jgi:ABC-type transport system involved in multi-copper enzyme maturation permease subunit
MITTLRSELLKIRSVPGVWVCFGLAFPLTVLIIWGVFASAGGFAGHTYSFVSTTQQKRNLLGAGYFGITFLAPVLGVICITSEYRHKTITSTFVLTPRRERVLAAKTLVTAWWCLLTAILTLIAVAAVGLPWNAALGGVTSQVTAQLGAVVPGLVAAAILFGLFGLGFGTLVKNQVTGILLTIGGTFILEPLLVLLARGVFHYDLNWLPSEAAASLAGSLARGGFGGNHDATTRYLVWWAGGLIMLGWGLIPLGLGYFTTVRRDVT